MYGPNYKIPGWLNYWFWEWTGVTLPLVREDTMWTFLHCRQLSVNFCQLLMLFHITLVGLLALIIRNVIIFTRVNKSHGLRVNLSNSQFLSMTADPMTNLIFLQFNQCHIYPMTDLISLQFNQCHNAIEWKVTSLFQGSLFSLSLSFSFGWSGHVSSSITSNV